MNTKSHLLFIIIWISLILNTSFISTQAQGLPRPLPNPNPQPLPPSPPEPPGQDPVSYTLGIGELDRFQEGRFVFYPRYDLNKVTWLSLTGLRNKILINEVRIQYDEDTKKKSEFNTKNDPALSLLGPLRPNQVKQIYLQGRSILSISIRASAWSYWENPGAFQVDVNANE